MHKLFLFAMALLLVFSGVAAAETRVAPADEYFGRLNLSILGIANTIKDMRLRIEADRTKTPTIFGSLEFVEDAIHDWERKFPADSWIPKNLLALEICYVEASGDRGRDLAARTEAWLARDYPKTAYARDGHEALAKAGIGFITMPSYAVETAVGPARARASSGDEPPVTTVPAAAP
jgi:hypothetical protein